MAELLSIDNFLGMVSDAPDGKQPIGTCKEIKNLVYDRERGSLVTRFTYENSLSKPSGVSTLSAWESKPITYPTPTDMHIWYTEDGIFQRPYWHNSSTATDDWVLITESKDLASISSANVTVNASPTNTIVITNATTTWGLSSTNDYYKNWIFQGTGGNTATYFVKSYSVSGSTATFTLDNVVTINWAVVPDYKLFRYFHKDYTFTPAFTSPSSYSTERAIRWSGGQGSTTGYKNIKSGYVNKLFFAGSGSSNRHQYTGTYIDQAECSAPASSLLTSSSFVEAYASDKIIKLSKDYDFDNASSTDWSSNGSVTASVGQTTRRIGIGTDPFGNIITANVPINGLLVKTSGTEGDYTTNYTELASNSTYLESVTSGSAYTLKIKGFSSSNTGQSAKVKIRVSKSDDSVNYDSAEINLKPDFSITQNGIETVISEGEMTFSPSFTGIPKIRIYPVGTADGASYQFVLTNVSVSLTANVSLSLDYGTTYKLFGSYVCDEEQESDVTLLGAKYITGKNAKLTYELNLQLGALNKFVKGVRIYASQEVGDTSSATTTSQAKYLIADIPIDDSATSAWVFDTAQGRFEYSGTITGATWNSKGKTWEQLTQRIASDSTTCSYDVSISASGRIFLAKDYDYADGQSYSNRIRYTGYNGYGIHCPDIFPNINDEFISIITAGKSQEIRNIVEYEGDVVVLKKSSVVRVNTSNPDPTNWDMLLIKDGVGSRSKRGALKFDKGIFFTDLYSGYLYNGVTIVDVFKGIWRNTYQGLVYTDTVAQTTAVWYNPINDTISVRPDNTLSATTKNYYEFNTNTWLPVFNQQSTSTYGFFTVVQTSDGVVHFAPESVGSYAFKLSSSYNSTATDWNVDTGVIDMPIGKRGVPKWLYILVGTPDPMTFYVYGDGSQIATATFTPSSASKTLYKYQLSTDYPVRRIEVVVGQTVTTSPATNVTKLHKILVTGNLVDEPTDVTLLAS